MSKAVQDTTKAEKNVDVNVPATLDTAKGESIGSGVYRIVEVVPEPYDVNEQPYINDIPKPKQNINYFYDVHEVDTIKEPNILYEVRDTNPAFLINVSNLLFRIRKDVIINGVALSENPGVKKIS